MVEYEGNEAYIRNQFLLGAPARFSPGDNKVQATALRYMLSVDEEVRTAGSKILALHRANIVDDLDLEGVTLPVSLHFYDCTFADINLKRVRVGQLEFFNCRVGEIDATGINVDGGVAVANCGLRGALTLVDSTIGGTVTLKESRFRCRTYDLAAVAMYRAKISGDLLLDDASMSARGHLGHSAFDLAGAQIGGALTAHGLRVFSDRDSGIFMQGATIQRNLVFQDFHSSSRGGPSLDLGSCSIGRLEIANSVISSAEGVAVSLSHTQSTERIQMTDVRLSSNSSIAVLSMPSVSVRADLMLLDLDVLNGAGPAFDLDAATFVDGYVSGRFFGASADTTVNLVSLQVKGFFTVYEAEIDNLHGPALGLERSRFDGAVYIDSDVHVIGAGDEEAVVSMSSARIEDELRLGFARLDNRDSGEHLVLLLEDVAVKNDLYFSIQDIVGDDRKLVGLDGLTFKNGPWRSSAPEWLRLVRENEFSYFAQPYLHIAEVARSRGNEDEWRDAMIQQQDDLRARGVIGGRWRRTVRASSGFFIGYGYKPWKALVWLLLTVAFAMSIVFLPGSDSYVRRQVNSGTGTCTVAEKLRVGASYAVPVINLNARRGCDVESDVGTPQAPAILLAATQLSGWVFTLLFIAGLTGLVRRVNP